MIVKTDQERAHFRASGRILADALSHLVAIAEEGVSAAELDIAAENYIREKGGEPTFLNYQPDGAPYPYPAALCISINDEVVHGIPSDEHVLKNGDIVSLDLGVTYEGCITDAARTVVIGGSATDDQKRLVEATAEALREAIGQVRAGAHVGDIGAVVSAVAKKHNLGVVRELGGHGVGKHLHEKPYIANYGAAGKGAELAENMVIALEPIFTLGNPEVYIEHDGYTYKTRDGSLAAHVEDTMLVTRDGAEILTRS
jgi:methionyl aminopeptidase